MRKAIEDAHKQGYHAGYHDAMHDAWMAIYDAINAVRNADKAQIERRYNAIYKGLDDTTVLEITQKHMPKTEAET